MDNVQRYYKAVRITVEEHEMGAYKPLKEAGFPHLFSSGDYYDSDVSSLPAYSAQWYLGFTIGGKRVDLRLSDESGIFTPQEFMNDSLEELAAKSQDAEWYVDLEHEGMTLIHSPLSPNMLVWDEPIGGVSSWFGLFSSFNGITLSEFLSKRDGFLIGVHHSEQEIVLSDGRKIVCKKSAIDKSITNNADYEQWKARYGKELAEQGDFLMSELWDIAPYPHASFKVLSLI